MTVDGVLTLPFAALITAVLLSVLRRSDMPTWRLAAVALFCFYLWGVASQTVFPVTIGRGVDAQPHTSFWTWMNLQPFQGLGSGAFGRQQAALNVLLGIPFGLLLPFLGNWSARAILIAGALFAIGIESLQFVEDAFYGYRYRTVDVNDVMLNWLGVAIGLTAYFVAALSLPWWPGRTRGDVTKRPRG